MMLPIQISVCNGPRPSSIKTRIKTMPSTHVACSLRLRPSSLRQGLIPMNIGISGCQCNPPTLPPPKGVHLISRRRGGRRTTNLRTAQHRRERPRRGRISESTALLIFAHQRQQLKKLRDRKIYLRGRKNYLWGRRNGIGEKTKEEGSFRFFWWMG